jgi:hypothetical protein
MAAQPICCGACSCPVPPEFWNRPEGVPCPRCRQNVQVSVFHAIAGTRGGALPEAIAADSEASCFYHPQSRAATLCDQCGRFLCRLCDIEIEGRHLCPACFQSGVSASKIEMVETRRTMYDSVALAFATFPALFIWPVLIGAPAALWVVFRRWRSPGSVVPRTRIRFYLAALIALAEIVGVVVLIWTIRQVPQRPGIR